MTARDIVADVFPAPGMADVLLERLREAGFVIVPVVATAGMQHVPVLGMLATATEASAIWDAMVEEWIRAGGVEK